MLGSAPSTLAGEQLSSAPTPPPPSPSTQDSGVGGPVSELTTGRVWHPAKPRTWEIVLPRMPVASGPQLLCWRETAAACGLSLCVCD